MAYFSSFHLGIPAVAKVTASHNPNGWTGVKIGFEMPLTHGPDDMSELRDIVLNVRVLRAMAAELKLLTAYLTPIWMIWVAISA